MWALIRDTNDGEMRVITEDLARGEYLNTHKSANKYMGNWELQATNADKDVLRAMARLTGACEKTCDYAVCFRGT
jgi:hypothetical protein